MNNFNLDSEKRVRKALVSVSLFTLVLSNIELASNEVTLLGLTIIVSLPQVLAVFMLTVVFLLIAFLLFVLEAAPRRISRFKRWRDNAWFAEQQTIIDDFARASDPRAEYEAEDERQRMMNPDPDEQVWMERQKRR